jgi:hypothetical protein
MNRSRVKVGVLLLAFLSIVLIAVGSAFSSATLPPADQDAPQSTTLQTLTPAASATPEPTETTENALAQPAADASATAFASLLAELPVDNAPARHTGYQRDYFMAWIDADSDGCNTRAEVLVLQSQSATSSRGRCTITTGAWYSPFDNQSFTLASDVDIDHLVPLKEAWISGAHAWDSSTRIQFGNDLGYAASLIAVSSTSNSSKSDSDPSEWLPPHRDYHCDYVASWVGVKWRWNLTVDDVEKMTLSSVLNGCTNISIQIPERAIVVIGGAPPAPVSDGVLDPDYGTCAIARANGAGPYISGVDPEYEWYTDRDKDGMVCE